MSLVKNLSLTTLQTLTGALKAQEEGSELEPHKVLRSAMSPAPVGVARSFRGQGGEQIIYIGLTVPAIHLDSHMLFCFTPPASIVPHFTLDAVHAGDHYAFHLDLIPRLELTMHPTYMREAYQPLTAHFQAGRAIPGLSPAHLSPMQIAVMSPWMLAHRASAESMDAVGRVCGQYLDYWRTLHDSGLPATRSTLSAATIATLPVRDYQHRSLLFSRELDPVWAQVDRLLGEGESEALRLLLRGKEPSSGSI